LHIVKKKTTVKCYLSGHFKKHVIWCSTLEDLNGVCILDLTI